MKESTGSRSLAALRHKTHLNLLSEHIELLSQAQPPQPTNQTHNLPSSSFVSFEVSLECIGITFCRDNGRSETALRSDFLFWDGRVLEAMIAHNSDTWTIFHHDNSRCYCRCEDLLSDNCIDGPSMSYGNVSDRGGEVDQVCFWPRFSR